MAYRLSQISVPTFCKLTVLVQLIVEDVATFFSEHKKNSAIALSPHFEAGAGALQT